MVLGGSGVGHGRRFGITAVWRHEFDRAQQHLLWRCFWFLLLARRRRSRSRTTTTAGWARCDRRSSTRRRVRRSSCRPTRTPHEWRAGDRQERDDLGSWCGRHDRPRWRGVPRFHTSGAGNTITISGITIRDGHLVAPSGSSEGGGVWNQDATLTLSDVVVTNNEVDTGGTPAMRAVSPMGVPSPTTQERSHCCAAR